MNVKHPNVLHSFSIKNIFYDKTDLGFQTLDVSRQRPMKSLWSVCPSPSVCPSLSFLKIGSLVFSDIVHDDS